MIDREWLERITIAYQVYSEQHGVNTSIEDFISWLYKQYGIIEQRKDDKC